MENVLFSVFCAVFGVVLGAAGMILVVYATYQQVRGGEKSLGGSNGLGYFATGLYGGAPLCALLGAGIGIYLSLRFGIAWKTIGLLLPVIFLSIPVCLLLFLMWHRPN